MAITDQKIFYVYELIDPRDGLCFYVGKGKNNRIYNHEKSARKNLKHNNPYLLNKIKKILSLGLNIIYNLPYTNLTEEDSFNKEAELIDFHNIDNLCNIVSGGGGISGLKHSVQSKEKISKASLKHWQDPDFRLKIIKATTGHQLSESTKCKMSKAKKGKKHTKEHSINNSKTKKKAWEDSDYRAHMSAVHKNVSPERRLQMSLEKKGKKLSEKTRNNMKIAQQKIHKDPIYKKNLSVAIKKWWDQRKEKSIGGVNHD